MPESGTKTTRKARKAATQEIPVDAIERRAYEKFVARGHAHGADFDDWRAAEEELAAELAPRPKRAGKAAAKGTDAAQPAPEKRAARAAKAPTAKSAAPRKAKKA